MTTHPPRKSRPHPVEPRILRARGPCEAVLSVEQRPTFERERLPSKRKASPTHRPKGRGAKTGRGVARLLSSCSASARYALMAALSVPFCSRARPAPLLRPRGELAPLPLALSVWPDGLSRAGGPALIAGWSPGRLVARSASLRRGRRRPASPRAHPWDKFTAGTSAGFASLTQFRFCAPRLPHPPTLVRRGA